MTICKDTFISSVIRPFVSLVETSTKGAFVGFHTSFDETYITIEVNNVRSKKDLKFILNAYENSFGQTPTTFERQGLRKRPHYYIQLVQQLS
jgi:hypothetical protein